MPNPIAHPSKSSNFSGVTGKTSDKHKNAQLASPKKAINKKESSHVIERAVTPMFIVPADEALEKDKADLKEQMLSSWAHSGGLPTKSGVVL